MMAVGQGAELMSQLLEWPENIVHSAVGQPFSSRNREIVNPQAYLREAVAWLERVMAIERVRAETLRHLKQIFSRPFQVYYTLSAISRRRVLDGAVRQEILDFLYPYRSSLERSVINSIDVLESKKELEKSAFNKSFFGVSKKQGVSLRLPLLSCVPTKNCGGRCYAHDGRDREIHLVFRAALNYFVALEYENGGRLTRTTIFERLKPAITYGAEMARADAVSAADEGFIRAPRIRFSHIGEAVAVPEFANKLASEIKNVDPEIQCVVYSRHPNIPRLDPDLFTVNFTLEGNFDPRKKYAPPSSRLVCSSWDGQINKDAEINFLEHHVEKVATASGGLNVCPVTAFHSSIKSCDEARCDRCFVTPSKTP